MAKLDKVDGVSDLTCNGTKWLLIYKTYGKAYVFHGQRCGQFTGKNITIEYFDTEQEMLDQATALGITLPTNEEPELSVR